MTISLLDVWNICGASPVGVCLPISISEDPIISCNAFSKGHRNSPYEALTLDDLSNLAKASAVSKV